MNYKQNEPMRGYQNTPHLGMDSQTQEVRKSGLMSNIDALEQAISGLSCAVDQIEIVMQPVMMPEPPQSPEVAGKSPREAASPAMESIESQTQRVNYLTARLHVLARRTLA